mmetsp:Transcript_83939/g.132182  ORF Transcript_83939/g.132182 Transcript_83939/m.132182 type:complete len:217 (+) Transcript_83939:590-1240(+)
MTPRGHPQGQRRPNTSSAHSTSSSSPPWQLSGARKHLWIQSSCPACLSSSRVLRPCLPLHRQRSRELLLQPFQQHCLCQQSLSHSSRLPRVHRGRSWQLSPLESSMPFLYLPNPRLLEPSRCRLPMWPEYLPRFHQSLPQLASGMHDARRHIQLDCLCKSWRACSCSSEKAPLLLSIQQQPHCTFAHYLLASFSHHLRQMRQSASFPFRTPSCIVR